MRSLRTRSGSIGAVCVEPARSDVAYVFDEEIVRGYGGVAIVGCTSKSRRGAHRQSPVCCIPTSARKSRRKRARSGAFIEIRAGCLGCAAASPRKARMADDVGDEPPVGSRPSPATCRKKRLAVRVLSPGLFGGLATPPCVRHPEDGRPAPAAPVGQELRTS